MSATAPYLLPEKEQWLWRLTALAQDRNKANFKLARLRNFVGEEIWWACMKDVDWDSDEARGLYEIEADCV